MSSLLSRPIERGAVDGGPVVERPSVVSVTDERRDWNFSLRATKSVSQFTCKDCIHMLIIIGQHSSKFVEHEEKTVLLLNCRTCRFSRVTDFSLNCNFCNTPQPWLPACPSRVDQ